MGEGDDTLVGSGEENDVIHGGEGNDSILGDFQDTVAGSVNEVLINTGNFRLIEMIGIICKILGDRGVAIEHQFELFGFSSIQDGNLQSYLLGSLNQEKIEEVISIYPFIIEISNQSNISSPIDFLEKIMKRLGEHLEENS